MVWRGWYHRGRRVRDARDDSGIPKVPHGGVEQLVLLPTSESGTYVSVPNQSVYSTRIFSTRLRSPLTFRPPLFVMLRSS